MGVLTAADVEAGGWQGHDRGRQLHPVGQVWVICGWKVRGGEGWGQQQQVCVCVWVGVFIPSELFDV
jgi:hypothetical protein